jgi:aminopeptidase N
MTNYSYSLGMIVFAIFYELVGADQFNQIIGSFYSRFHLTGATLDDFIHHCQQTAGPELERFFDDWIYSTHGIQLLMEGKSFQELMQFYKTM